jgi:hypothetical protein
LTLNELPNVSGAASALPESTSADDLQGRPQHGC